MPIKTTNNGAAAVNTELFWLPIDKVPPPNGPKLLLINRRYGAATMGAYSKTSDWTHWQALPRFKENEDELTR